MSIYENNTGFSPIFKHLLQHNGVVCKHLVSNDGDGIVREERIYNNVRMIFGEANRRSNTVSVGDNLGATQTKLLIDATYSKYEDGRPIEPPTIQSTILWKGREWIVKEILDRETTSIHHWSVVLT